MEYKCRFDVVFLFGGDGSEDFLATRYGTIPFVPLEGQTFEFTDSSGDRFSTKVIFVKWHLDKQEFLVLFEQQDCVGDERQWHVDYAREFGFKVAEQVLSEEPSDGQ